MTFNSKSTIQSFIKVKKKFHSDSVSGSVNSITTSMYNFHKNISCFGDSEKYKAVKAIVRSKWQVRACLDYLYYNYSYLCGVIICLNLFLTAKVKFVLKSKLEFYSIL